MEQRKQAGHVQPLSVCCSWITAQETGGRKGSNPSTNRFEDLKDFVLKETWSICHNATDFHHFFAGP